MSGEKNSLLPSWKGSGVIGHLDPFSGNLCAKPSLPQYSPSAGEELPAAREGREGGRRWAQLCGGLHTIFGDRLREQVIFLCPDFITCLPPRHDEAPCSGKKPLNCLKPRHDGVGSCKEQGKKKVNYQAGPLSTPWREEEANALVTPTSLCFTVVI